MRSGFPLELSASATPKDFSFHSLFTRDVDSQAPLLHFAIVTLGPEPESWVSPLLVCSLRNMLDSMASHG